MKPRENLIHHAEFLILFVLDFVQLRLVNVTAFIHPVGHLIDVIAQDAAQQPDSLVHLRQIQFLHVTIQRHRPDVGRLVADPGGLHLLPDTVGLRFRCFETVVGCALVFGNSSSILLSRQAKRKAPARLPVLTNLDSLQDR